MDELLQHCLRELAFDGDLGCNVSRLRDFITEFYASHVSMRQTLDDSYHAFVWALVAQQPSVRVGLLPEGQSSEVYIPPQPRAAKRTSRDGDDGKQDALAVTKLESIQDANAYPLHELLKKYGDRLRLATDPETCFVAITGSHAKPAKLTPMVYASLQLIARARESGLSVLELGRATGYDQKTCFYLVKQLLELDLVVKLRRGGTSQNFCVHKYFFDRSATWKKIREEEFRAQGTSNDNGDSVLDSAGADSKVPDTLQFDPIDTRHLTSLNILRQRLVKLLKHSVNEIQPYNNIAVRIGFRPRSRTDRRFFIARLKELIAEGTIEKILVTSANPNITQNRQLCLRLVSSEKDKVINQDANIIKASDEEEKEEDMIENLITDDPLGDQKHVKSTMTLHKQIIDLMQDSSATGITLNELSDHLNSFDKRTLELLISRMERQAPPSHLADLCIIQVLETHGRERRYRFFTLSGYSELMAREGLQQPSSRYTSQDLAITRGFNEACGTDFYEICDDLAEHLSRWSGGSSGRPRKIGDVAGACADEMKKSKKVKWVFIEDGWAEAPRKKKEKNWINPILPDGTRKRGRPVKDPELADRRRQKRTKKGQETTATIITGDDQVESGSNSDSTPTKHGVKRKRSNSSHQRSEGARTNVDATARDGLSASPTREFAKRKRGRPSKRVQGATSGPKMPLPLTTMDNASEVQILHGTSENALNVSAQSARYTPVCEGKKARTSTVLSDSAVASAASRTLSPESNIPRPLTPASGGSLSASSPVPVQLEHTPSTADPSTFIASSALDQNSRFLGSPSTFQQTLGKERRDSVDEVAKAITSLTVKANEHAPALINLSERPSNPPAQGNASRTSLANDLSCHISSSYVPVEHVVELEGYDTLRFSGVDINGVGVVGNNQVGANADFSTGRDFMTAHSGSIVQSAVNNPSPGASYKRKISTRFLGRTNLTAMRRENELVQLVENAGGIVNTSSSEFLLTFMQLIEDTVKAGEAVSAPVGTKMDRRTLNYSLDNLVSRGRIKTVITNISSIMGGNRNSKIAYLPTVSDEQLHDYIAAQGATLIQVPRRQAQIRELARKELEANPDNTLALANKWLYELDSHEIYHERWHKNSHRAQTLFEHSDDVIREALLLEKQTLSQSYGYLTGKVMRAKKLHLHSVHRFEHDSNSLFIVSSEQMIVSWAFFENDMSLSTYCACVASLCFSEEIKGALTTEEGRDKSVRDIPDEWRNALHIGKARSRDRISDLLEFLCSMKIVTPLQQAESDGPFLPHCPTNGLHPAAFEAVRSDWASRVPVVRPKYWQFNRSAPIYQFALQEDPPPFLKDMRISSENEVEAFWEELRLSCLDEGYAREERSKTGTVATPHKSHIIDQHVAAALRRTASWRSDYTLSWYQTQYLKKFVDLVTGNTPVQDADGGAFRLQQISYITSAPIEVARKYFVTSREDLLAASKRVRGTTASKKLSRQRTEVKSLLAQKAVETVKNREISWDALVGKVHPGSLKGVAASRLRKLRQSYIIGNTVQDNRQWETHIVEAIEAAKKSRLARKLFPQVTLDFKAQQEPAINTPLPRNLLHGRPINMQKHASDGNSELKEINNCSRPCRKTAEARASTRVGRVRRQRFSWNPELDELVRDASVIVRARCRAYHRLEWAALDQIFPFIPRNSVRARILVLRDQPGAESYLQRLENCWYELWVKKRGTPELPDENYCSPTEFDLKAHLEYLRKYIDKNSIRVGISNDKGETDFLMPADLNEITSFWTQHEHGSVYANWDFLFNNAVGEEARERLFLEGAFVVENEVGAEEDADDSIYFAESALKMVIGTPNESYDGSMAASLLQKAGEKDITVAMDNLLSQNVLARLVRDPSRLIPGRTAKISETNQNALGGTLPADFFSDASQLEESYALSQDEWREWPLVSTDGDTAAILQQISDYKAEFVINTEHAQTTRANVDGNSRKVDDDDIELGIRVKFSDIPFPSISVELLSDNFRTRPEVVDPSDHGLSINGDKACCHKLVEGVIDCLKCIEDATAQLSSWSDEDKLIAHSIMEHVENRTTLGIEVDELKAALRTEYAGDLSATVIYRLYKHQVPILYFVGYSSSVIISAKYVGPRTVTLTGVNQSVRKMFPRRWLDITTGRTLEVWDAALRAVMGLIHMRPGMSQAELRWRLRAVYDRQEIADVLSHLVTNGSLRAHFGVGSGPVYPEAISKREEASVYWFVQEGKHWYLIT
ncbi:hypothetical protein M0805_000310 [Coniferiporia weirii]|nr:hypothetical protein M0805_000310 [Coniferiporia weirii]